MTNKKTLKLTQVPERNGVSLVDGATIVYGTPESVTSGTIDEITNGTVASLPEHGFFAASPENFEGFPDEGAVEVSDSFSGSALIFDNARITPTVNLQCGERGYILAMTGNSYITDATIVTGYGIDVTHLDGNAIVRGGRHRELRANENGYVENSSTDCVYVTDRARLINVPAVTASIFGSDAEVNFARVSKGAKNAATKLMAISQLSWSLSDTQPFIRRAHTPPRELTTMLETPQDMWDTLPYTWGNYSYIYDVALALQEAPEPDEATLCLASTLHKKQKEHCKCMFYYGLYLLADPLALHYFSRLEGNKPDASHPLSSVGYRTLEDCMSHRIIELKEAFGTQELYPQDVFLENLTIPYQEISRTERFRCVLKDLQKFKKARESESNELMWYLNYLQVAHNITPDQFLDYGSPDRRILEMTARTRGII